MSFHDRRSPKSEIRNKLSPPQHASDHGIILPKNTQETLPKKQYIAILTDT